MCEDAARGQCVSTNFCVHRHSAPCAQMPVCAVKQRFVLTARMYMRVQNAMCYVNAFLLLMCTCACTMPMYDEFVHFGVAAQVHDVGL